MSSGTYFPPPVRTVEIPKSDGGKRALGIPTVSDRVAQMVVKMYLEPMLEPISIRIHMGIVQGNLRYRPWRWPGKDAGSLTGYDLDIKGFFDNMDHELVMKAVRKHTE